MSDDIEPVGWIYPDGTYTPHRENLEQWGWSPVYAAATIERLTKERDEAIKGEEFAVDKANEFSQLADDARRELAKARNALEPFAKAAGSYFAQNYNDGDIVATLFAKGNKAPKAVVKITFGDLRRARAALAPEGK